MAELKEARVPDIGDYSDVPVIEVLVAVGDTVAKDQGLVTLESDKATMEVPAPFAGVVQELKVKLGDTLSEGVGRGHDRSGRGRRRKTCARHPLLLLRTKQEVPASETGAKVEPVAVAAQPDKLAQREIAQEQSASDARRHRRCSTASPASIRKPRRRTARRSNSTPTRCCRRKSPTPARRCACSRANSASTCSRSRAASAPAASARKTCSVTSRRRWPAAVPRGGASAPMGAGGSGLNLLPWPKVDFAKFGEIEVKPLSRIKKISGANLARNWAMIPHVTQHDDADITGLEELRVQLNKENEKAGIKLTMLVFIMKAVVAGLKKYPDFNASLDASGENLTLKKYFHIGFAADTPNGLVVPVIRDVDKKGVAELAKEMGELAGKARDGKLGPAEMSGGCFSISSLGGIGGTAFTPIVNAPEVAILGVSKSSIQPVWDGKAVPAAPAAAAVAELRPPRHRRRLGRALHRLPGAAARRHAPRAAVSASGRSTPSRSHKAVRALRPAR